jgi:hypothetical protein
MPSLWITALQQYNGTKGPWCIPRKGTKEYDDVKGIMEGKKPTKKIEDAPAVKAVAMETPKKKFVFKKAEPTTGSVAYYEKQKEKFKGTKYEKFIDAEIEEAKNKKSMAKEINTNMKDPVKVKKLIDIVETSKKEHANKEREITAMMATIKAPTGTKKEIIEMIESLVTDPVDRLKLKLSKRDKSMLQTIYMNTKARHDWYKKNKPGQAIDYDLD